MKRRLLLILPFALAACTEPPQAEPATPPALAAPTTATPPPADAAALSAHHWRLTDAKDARGQRIDALFVDADKPLQLDFAEGRVGVSNTCNRMGGAYSVEGGRLKVGRMVSTQMACADARLMALEREIGERLEGASTLALQSGDAPTLALTTGNGDVLTFNGEPTAETRYGGKGETAFLEIAAQTRPCSHPLIPGMQCLQAREIEYDAQGVKTGADGVFQNLYEGIEGYAHEPGVRNVLRVKRYERDPVPADASPTVYVLDMVVESEIVKP